MRKLKSVYKWMLFLGVLVSLNLAVWSCNQSVQGEVIAEESPDVDQNDSPQIPLTLGDQIVAYATTLLNTPYKVAGKDSLGFDCSGFVSYVFKKHGIQVPSSSRHIAELGEKISTEEAKPGDLIFFRGTDPNSTEVGHIGIVVSLQGEPIKFIHSSSAQVSPYVKYDSLARPNYNRRFIMVKRILDKE